MSSRKPSREPVEEPKRDLEILERLREGDESAFADLVDQLGTPMLRIARMYVSTHAVAEEVVQETWLGVLRGSIVSRGGRPCEPGSSES